MFFNRAKITIKMRNRRQIVRLWLEAAKGTAVDWDGLGGLQWFREGEQGNEIRNCLYKYHTRAD